MINLELFASFLQVGLFSIGGGLAALPLIQNQIVSVHGWLTLSEFVDIVSIAEMAPGPISINAATFVGIRVAGIPGAIVATAGSIFPSCVIVITLAYLYQRYKSLTIIQGILSGMRPAVVALIASAGYTIFLLAIFGTQPHRFGNINFLNAALILAGIASLRIFKPNPLWVIGGSGLIGLFCYFQNALIGSAQVWLYLIAAAVFTAVALPMVLKKAKK